MRAFGRHHVCYSVAALIAVLPHEAAAQEAAAQTQASAQDDEPEPDPGGLDIQYPRPRLLAMATLGASNEYRDRLLSDRNIGSVSGGIAYMGFSASGWQSWELSTDKDAHELIVGYSYKLPLVDVHAAYVVCGNERMLRGCPDGFRFTLTTNSIARTTLEASVDLAVNSKRRSVSASATRDLWDNGETSGAVRASWTHSDYGGSVHLNGASLRLIAARPIAKRLELNFAAGYVWTWGQARLPEARDGVIATTSLVWRY